MSQKRKTLKRGTNEKIQKKKHGREKTIAENDRKRQKDYGEKLARNKSITWKKNGREKVKIRW